MIFTFSPASINIIDFTPASYQTSYPDTYTGSADGNVLTYDGVFLPVHNSNTLCNTFTITIDDCAFDELSIQTNDYPSTQCTRTIPFPDDYCDTQCVSSFIKSSTTIAIPLGLQGAVSETVDGLTYAPFYDAYRLKFTDGTPPYSYSGWTEGDVRYNLNNQTNELTIYGPVSSNWEIVVTGADGCSKIFPRPPHVVPTLNAETLPLHIPTYDITGASSGSATDGAIDITPFTDASNPDYTYVWLSSLNPSNPPFADTEDVADLAKKTYFLRLVSQGYIGSDPLTEVFFCGFVLPIQSNKNEAEEVALLFDEITETSVNVYPNPVSDRAYVNISTNEECSAMVELYNINGQKVATIFDGELNTTNQFEFSTENLSNGLYFVKTTSSTGFQDAYKIQVLK